MLTTGVRTPVGIKIYGADIHEIERIGTEIEAVLPSVAGTRSVFAERTSGGYFLDFNWKRDELARYGLSMDDAQMVVMTAIGGDNVTTTVEGRERYPVNVRYLPRLPQRPRSAASRARAGHGRPDADPARPARRRPAGHRPVDAAQRKRHAERLCLRGRRRPRHRQLRGRGQARGRRAREAARRLLAVLERPVRSDGAGPRAPEDRPAADAVPHLPAALPEHAVDRQDGDHRPAGRAVLGDRRDLAALCCSATT